jgi:hypothetical protein
MDLPNPTGGASVRPAGQADLAAMPAATAHVPGDFNRALSKLDNFSTGRWHVPASALPSLHLLHRGSVACVRMKRKSARGARSGGLECRTIHTPSNDIGFHGACGDRL